MYIIQGGDEIMSLALVSLTDFDRSVRSPGSSS
jgi:hypothetical protein